MAVRADRFDDHACCSHCHDHDVAWTMTGRDRLIALLQQFHGNIADAVSALGCWGVAPRRRTAGAGGQVEPDEVQGGDGYQNRIPLHQEKTQTEATTQKHVIGGVNRIAFYDPLRAVRRAQVQGRQSVSWIAATRDKCAQELQDEPCQWTGGALAAWFAAAASLPTAASWFPSSSRSSALRIGAEGSPAPSLDDFPCTRHVTIVGRRCRSGQPVMRLFWHVIDW